MKTPSRKAKLKDVKRIILATKSINLSFSRYRNAGGTFSKSQIYSDGDSWGNLCKECGIEMDRSKDPICDTKYFERLNEFVEKNKRLPKTNERKLARLNFKKSRWSTLHAFIEDAINRGFLSQDFRQKSNNIVDKPKQEIPFSRNREVDGLKRKKEHCRPEPRIPKKPLRPDRRNWEWIGINGMPYAPRDENGVIALFAILCHKGDLKLQIVETNDGKGIDSICYDDENECEIRIEFKFILSKPEWNHDTSELDIVVCWENRWREFPKPVIELKSFLKNMSASN